MTWDGRELGFPWYPNTSWVFFSFSENSGKFNAFNLFLFVLLYTHSCQGSHKCQTDCWVQNILINWESSFIVQQKFFESKSKSKHKRNVAFVFGEQERISHHTLTNFLVIEEGKKTNPHRVQQVSDQLLWEQPGPFLPCSELPVVVCSQFQTVVGAVMCRAGLTWSGSHY